MSVNNLLTYVLCGALHGTGGVLWDTRRRCRRHGLALERPLISWSLLPPRERRLPERGIREPDHAGSSLRAPDSRARLGSDTATPLALPSCSIRVYDTHCQLSPARTRLRRAPLAVPVTLHLPPLCPLGHKGGHRSWLG